MSGDANDDEAGNDGVHPNVFVSELARQVYTDLDGVLSEDGRATTDAMAALQRAAQAGAPRMRALWLLLRSGLAAFHALRFGREETFIEPGDAEVHAVMAAFIPESAATTAVAADAARIAGAMHLSGNRAETLHGALALAVYRLYDGLRSDDERLSASGLMELRTMLAHLDAAACLDAADLVGVVRPDRFHDDFLRYVSAAQGGAGDAQQAVAALQQDGRITAIVTHDVHPVEHARQAVAEGQGIACLRIEALLDFLQRHRGGSDPLVRAANDNETVFTALITAAATSPLAGSVDGFDDAALTQIARYNLRLLQAVAPRSDHVH